jgi:cysteine desulfurase
MRYFDHNATAPLYPVARDEWLRAAEQFIGNPSSPHRLGGRAEAALDDARARLAKLLDCDELDLVWTSGATESNNLVLHHHAKTLPADREVWISAIEHPCVAESARVCFGNRCRIIPVTCGGVIDLDWLARKLTKSQPGLIAVMAANNVTGILQPWREVLALCRQHGVPFFCDAVQWLGRLPAEGLGACDWLSGCAHKAGGPRGIGFLKCPPTGRVTPLIHGGPQEEGRRAGTENVAGALALVALLEARAKQMPGIADLEAMRRNFSERLLRRLPGSEVLGTGQPSLWNTVAVLMPETDCPQRWVVKLDKLGFAVSTGSACSSGQEEPSPVLLAMQLPPEKASRVLRLSSGWETTAEDWDALLEGLVAAAKELGVAVKG